MKAQLLAEGNDPPKQGGSRVVDYIIDYYETVWANRTRAEREKAYAEHEQTWGRPWEVRNEQTWGRLWEVDRKVGEPGEEIGDSQRRGPRAGRGPQEGEEE